MFFNITLFRKGIIFVLGSICLNEGKMRNHFLYPPLCRATGPPLAVLITAAKYNSASLDQSTYPQFPPPVPSFLNSTIVHIRYRLPSPLSRFTTSITTSKFLPPPSFRPPSFKSNVQSKIDFPHFLSTILRGVSFGFLGVFELGVEGDGRV